MINRSTVWLCLIACLAATTPHEVRSEWQSDIMWVLLVAFLFAFILAFAVGANDVANSFGTAVGSKVLTMKQAFTLASIMETSGAVLLGSKVGETIRKGIVDPTFYYDDEMCDNFTYPDMSPNVSQYLCPTRLNNATLFLYGQLSAMLGAASWQIIATLCKLPVSGTHSIVGAIVGFHVAAKGWNGIAWSKMGKIVMSWFLSPVLAGLMSVFLFWLLHVNIIIPAQSDEVQQNKKGQRLGLLLLPIFYGATIFVNIYALLHHQEDGGLLDSVAYKSQVSIFGSVLIAILVGIISYFIFVRSFESEWFGPDGTTTEKVKLNGLNSDEKKVDSEYTDSGYHERIKKLDDKPGNSGLQSNAKPSDKPGCFTQANTIPQAPIIAARLLSHIERNDSFASSRGNQSHANLQRLRMTSNKSEGDLQRTRVNSDGSMVTDSRFKRYSESSEIGGLTMMTSPSRRPTEKVIIEDPSSLNEDDLNNEVFEDNELGSQFNLPKTESENRIDKLFEKLQILTSCFGSFAHGGNDVANAIGPLIAVWLLYSQGGIDIPQSLFGIDPATQTPWFLLLFGGVGITAGLWTCGAKLIVAMGEDITTITPCRGFCIELMSAFTVLGASAMGIPVSTTHCKVGSIVAIGIYGKTGIPKKQIINIALAWFVTVPTSGLLSAIIMKILMAIKPL